MEKLHPKAVWLFFFQFLFVFVGFGFIITMFFIFPLLGIIEKAATGRGFPGGWLILCLFLYIVFCYIWAKLTYRFWGYELAENAIKVEKGVIWKKYISIPYERVQNVDIYRGVFARIFGLSDLHIQTAGYSSHRKHGMGSEGRLPGLDPKIAEQLREELVKRSKGTKQGL